MKDDQGTFLPPVKGKMFHTGDLTLVTFLTLKGYAPEYRTEEKEKSILHYEKTVDLDHALIEYNDKCPICGIVFSEMRNALPEARRRLLDGMLNGKRL